MSSLAFIDPHRVYQSLFVVYISIGIGVFCLFTVAIISVAVWHRVHPPAHASRRHEADRVEIAYAVALTCVAAVLLTLTFTAEHKDDVAFASERPALTIDVTGSRWEWTFDYPRYGITRRSGAVGHQSVMVPVNEPIRFRLRSADVIHSFWLPQLGFKRDAMPGTVESVTLDFDHRGRYSGACAEFCGLLHSDMVFTVYALRDGAFEAWARGGGPP